MKNNDRAYDLVGLSSTEKKILEGLSIARKVQDLVRQTGISRTGINYHLNTLIEKGFLRVIKEGKRKKYLALTQEEIINQIQESINEIKTNHSNQKGARVKTTREDEFVIHVDARKIIPAYERIASKNKNERIKAIQHHRSYNTLQEKMTSSQLISFNRTIIKNHLIIEGMLNESAYRDYKEEIKTNPKKYKDSVQSLEGRMADYTLFADNYFNYNAELWLFKNTSLFINWYDEVAIEITNQSITSFLKDMFEFVKKDGKKIDHNRVLRSVLENRS